MTVGYDEAVSLMSKHGQDHVFMFWDKLNGTQRSNLLSQIGSLDFAGIARIKNFLPLTNARQVLPKLNLPK